LLRSVLDNELKGEEIGCQKASILHRHEQFVPDWRGKCISIFGTFVVLGEYVLGLLRKLIE
jgi:hypothetical protein